MSDRVCSVGRALMRSDNTPVMGEDFNVPCDHPVTARLEIEGIGPMPLCSCHFDVVNQILDMVES